MQDMLWRRPACKDLAEGTAPYWLPRSLWKMVGEAGVESLLHGLDDEIAAQVIGKAQPTMRREHRSMTTAR